jgi:alkylation response protein AidB-like acyl-CoA dehydrogenase
VGHSYLAMTHLNAEGDERIQTRLFSNSGDKIGALCITRTFGGSDRYAYHSYKKKGDKYIINGSKTFITNGVYGDYYVVTKLVQSWGIKRISMFFSGQ